jgi:hypothetical protein
MWDEMVRRYGWLRGDERVRGGELFESYTVSVVRGRTEDEVISGFGGDPAAEPQMLTLAEAIEEESAHGGYADDYALLRVVSSGEYVVATEVGYRGSIPEIARRLSADGGEFFSAYANVNARHQVMHAQDGRVDGRFDPFDVADLEGRGEDDPPEELPAWAQDVAFHTYGLDAEAFALMERTMGLPIRAEWFSSRLRTVPLAAEKTLFDDDDAAWEA